jgi:hypothetical protein
MLLWWLFCFQDVPMFGIASGQRADLYSIDPFNGHVGLARSLMGPGLTHVVDVVSSFIFFN